jgi:ATP-dependent DNA helicase RecG
MVDPVTPVLTRDAPLERLKGIGPKRAVLLRASGLATVGELLQLPPHRHVAFAAPTPIARLEAGVAAAIRVRVKRRKGSGRRGIVVSRLDVEDASGALTAFLFGPRWLVNSYATNEEVVLVGDPQRRGESLSFLVRGTLHQEELPSVPVAALLPAYRLPDGLAPRFHRRLLRATLAALSPTLEKERPDWAAAALGGSVTLAELYRWLHFPADRDEAAQARRAFSFAAAVELQARLLKEKRTRAPRPGGAYRSVERELALYRAALPYTLTGDQERALADVAADLATPEAMSRLLTGDVGSGKTAVAFLPLIMAARAGRQGALLAPTELLARQHAATLAPIAAQLSLAPPLLCVAGEGATLRGAPLDAALVVGTHRLFSLGTKFRDLAAVVVDEQHKFGVRQRFRLWSKGERPDLLLVSATPIPRTLAMTLFGHLDLSVLTERPFTRRQVRTELLLDEARRDLATRIRTEIDRGGKAFVVCPAIKATDAGDADGAAGANGKASPRAAAETFAPWLAARLADPNQLALLHGRMESAEKQARIADFTSGRLRVLVATVVVEVGIDVPDASLAVVLSADRFGLSQLHQIRGRVGRRGEPAGCLLVAAKPNQATRERLESFAATDDGFKLAEMDLEQRGPGELLGTLQHGLAAGLYPEALTDAALIAAARSFAAERADHHKSSLRKPFRSRTVASSDWIW